MRLHHFSRFYFGDGLIPLDFENELIAIARQKGNVHRECVTVVNEGRAWLNEFLKNVKFTSAQTLIQQFFLRKGVWFPKDPALDCDIYWVVALLGLEGIRLMACNLKILFPHRDTWDKGGSVTQTVEG